jgi:hypothetical protein
MTSPKTFDDVQQYITSSLIMGNSESLTEEMRDHMASSLTGMMPWKDNITKQICQHMKCYGSISIQQKKMSHDMHMSWKLNYSGVGNNVIGLGLTVISNGKVLGQVLIPAFADHVEFDDKIWKNYWLYKHKTMHGELYPHMLNLHRLYYETNDNETYDDVLRMLTLSFFVVKAYFENIAYQSDVDFNKSTNNPGFELGLLNELNKKYLSQVEPTVHPNVEYSSIKYQTQDDVNNKQDARQQYKKIVDIDSVLIGFLSSQLGIDVQYETNNPGQIIQDNYNYIVNYPSVPNDMPQYLSHKSVIDMENYRRIMSGTAELTWTNWAKTKARFIGLPKVKIPFIST